MFVVGLLTSCGFISAQKELADFIEMEVVIPNDLICYYNGIDTTMDIVNDLERKLIVYYDSTVCSICQVSHLLEWHEVIDYNKWTQGEFGVVFIFSPKVEEYNEIERTIGRNRSVNAAVLLDKNGDFAKQNTHIPKNRNYHTFLLDENNKVVVVGNPMGNEKRWKLYKEQITAK